MIQKFVTTRLLERELFRGCSGWEKKKKSKRETKTQYPFYYLAKGETFVTYKAIANPVELRCEKNIFTLVFIFFDHSLDLNNTQGNQGKK